MGKHAGLVERLRAFQTNHFEDRQNIGNFNYESECCWANLEDQYIVEAASPIRTDMYTLSELLGVRLGEAELVTSQLSERGIVANVLFVFV
jgi:hypothetical protein